MKRISAFVIVALVLVWRGLPFAAPVTVTFLHTNDIYLIDQQDGHGGFPKLMTLLKQERVANPNAITTFGGDLFSPSVMSGFTKGSQMVELMDAIGLDYAVPGNHEFDFGPETFEQNIKASQAVWLAANLRRADGNPVPGVLENAIVDIEGIKIGLFGVITPETVTLSSGGDAFNFTEPVTTARFQVEKLRSQGADFIVAFTHLDWAEDRGAGGEPAARPDGHLYLSD